MFVDKKCPLTPHADDDDGLVQALQTLVCNMLLLRFLLLNVATDINRSVSTMVLLSFDHLDGYEIVFSAAMMVDLMAAATAVSRSMKNADCWDEIKWGRATQICCRCTRQAF